MKLAAILSVVLAASTAHASVWDDAISPDAHAQDTYETELRQGDEHALQANTRGISFKEEKNQVTQAAAAYRAAAAAKPSEGEPYFRLATLIYSFYIECTDDTQNHNYWSLLCNPRILDRARTEEVIEAWDAFEARSPMDPRLSVGPFGESEVLFRRAILHTKLATPEHLEAASRDYEKILARSDDAEGGNEPVVGNLAETYMMLGKLDDAIETYKEALRSGSDTSTWYGYAVALDRDERSQQALEVIRSLGREQRDQFHANVIRGVTFFVPEGEKFYYFALVDEALGLDEDAINYWRQFISSGAHPQFQPRAKVHLDALLKKKRKFPLPVEPPWGGLLR